MPTSRLLSVCLCAGVLLAGCGGSDDTFKKDFRTQLIQLRGIGTQVSGELRSARFQGAAERQAAFAALARRTQPVVDGIARLKPPARFRNDIRQMHDSLAGAVADLQAISRTAGANDRAGVSRAYNALVADSARVKAADNRVAKALGLPPSR